MKAKELLLLIHFTLTTIAYGLISALKTITTYEITATESNDLHPSETAFPIAVLSAHQLTG